MICNHCGSSDMNPFYLNFKCVNCGAIKQTVKIRGFQLSTSPILTRWKPEGREVIYVKDITEITVDTDKGNFIISRDDLLNVIVERVK